MYARYSGAGRTTASALFAVSKNLTLPYLMLCSLGTRLCLVAVLQGRSAIIIDLKERE